MKKVLEAGPCERVPWGWRFRPWESEREGTAQAASPSATTTTATPSSKPVLLQTFNTVWNVLNFVKPANPHPVLRSSLAWVQGDSEEPQLVTAASHQPEAQGGHFLILGEMALTGQRTTCLAGASGSRKKQDITAAEL